MKHSLNEGQQEAVDKMKDFLNTPNISGEPFVLTGGPGTGKTFITKYAVSSTNYNYRIAGATISHAAKTILQEHIGRIKCFTLAGILGLTMTHDKNGNVLFKETPNASKPLNKFDAVLVDEISMIDDNLHSILMTQASNNGIKVIAIGDRYQLPPVEQEHDSKFFDNINAELTQPMRFFGPIGELAKIYRQEIQNFNKGETFDKYALNAVTKRQSVYDNTLNSGYKFLNDVSEVVEMAASDIKLHSYDKNFTRILAFKNSSVDALNSGIRSHLYGKNVSEFEENEILILNNNYYGGGSSPVLYNGEIVRVDSYIEDVGPYDIPCARLKLKDFVHRVNPPVYTILRKNPESVSAYNKQLNKLRQNALKNPKEWVVYSKFLSRFADFNYAYAVNLYRAQGATVKNAYVFEGEVMAVKPLTWKQKFQALYVAVTRPSKNLIIYNKSF